MAKYEVVLKNDDKFVVECSGQAADFHGSDFGPSVISIHRGEGSQEMVVALIPESALAGIFLVEEEGQDENFKAPEEEDA